MQAVATYQPAQILNVDKTLFRSAMDHMRILHRLLDGDMILYGCEPQMEDVRPPTEEDSKCLCVDIETYGMIAGYEQTVFHPKRMEAFDSYDQMVQTVAITQLRADKFDLDGIRAADIGGTMVFTIPEQSRTLQQWLDHAKIVVGQNIPFDVLCLRHAGLDVRPEKCDLFDLQAANYLDSEVRIERSLKDIGEVLGLYNRYGDRFDYPDRTDRDLHLYNGRDTHRTLCALRELALRIRRDYTTTTKLSKECVTHYSNVLWNCIYMSEEGVPFDIPGLTEYSEQLETKIKDLVDQGLTELGIPLIGKGSQKHKINIFTKAAEIAVERDPTFRFEVSEKTNNVCTHKENREKFLEVILPTDPIHKALLLYDELAGLTKLLGTYCRPILEGDGKVRHINGVVYPTWFAVPTVFDGGDEGGTVQSRLSAKNPAVQTLPPTIKRYVDCWWADLSQIELRIAAILSGDKSLMAAFWDGVDLHTQRAHTIWPAEYFLQKYGTPTPDSENVAFSKFERQCAKHANFTDLNLAGASTLQATIKKKGGIVVPIEECNKIVDLRPFSRPQLHEWQQRVIHESSANGYYEIRLTGHSRHYPGNPDDMRDLWSTMVNFPIQTHAANLFHDIQAFLRRRGIPQCAQVHDSVLIPRRIPKEQATEAMADAVAYTFERGYCRRLIEETGHECPIQFAVEG